MNAQSDREFQKLRRLMALKRYERPRKAYFETFLNEFNRRQRRELIWRRDWWTQWTRWLFTEPTPFLRYAISSALVLLVCANAFLLSQRRNPPASANADHSSRGTQLVSNMLWNSTPEYILDRVPVEKVSYGKDGEF
jgi:hypothetical protein